MECFRQGKCTVSILKTRKSRESVAGFVGKIQIRPNPNDCRTILALMKQAVRSRPSTWGSSIVGYTSVGMCIDAGPKHRTIR